VSAPPSFEDSEWSGGHGCRPPEVTNHKRCPRRYVSGHAKRYAGSGDGGEFENRELLAIG